MLQICEREGILWQQAFTALLMQKSMTLAFANIICVRYNTVRGVNNVCGCCPQHQENTAFEPASSHNRVWCGLFNRQSMGRGRYEFVLLP
jgi:hypothetical protein